MSKFDEALADLDRRATDEEIVDALTEAGMKNVLGMHLSNARKHLERKGEQLKPEPEPQLAERVYPAPPLVVDESVLVVEEPERPAKHTAAALPDLPAAVAVKTRRRRSMSVHFNDQADRKEAARCLRELAQTIEDEGLWAFSLDYSSDGNDMMAPDWNRTVDGDYSHGWWDVVESDQA